MYTRQYVLLHMNGLVYVHTPICTLTYEWTGVCTHANMNGLVYVHTPICTLTYEWTGVCTHANMYSYI